jgi:hypothetical protein
MSTTPMRATAATDEAVLFEVESTSADSEPVKMLVQFHDPGVRSAWSKGLAAPRARERAFSANPICIECGERISAPSLAGLIETAAGHRVAHKTPCFVRAVSKLNPTFTKSAAMRRAEVR